MLTSPGPQSSCLASCPSLFTSSRCVNRVCRLTPGPRLGKSSIKPVVGREDGADGLDHLSSLSLSLSGVRQGLMAMISGAPLLVACINLSRVRSLLRTLAIAEYGYMVQI
jgi:hypothetical protein